MISSEATRLFSRSKCHKVSAHFSRNDGLQDARSKMTQSFAQVEKLLRDGSFSTEKIAEVADVSLEQVRQIAQKLTVTV